MYQVKFQLQLPYVEIENVIAYIAKDKIYNNFYQSILDYLNNHYTEHFYLDRYEQLFCSSEYIEYSEKELQPDEITSCQHCDILLSKKESIDYYKFFDKPFDIKAQEYYFCSEACVEAYKGNVYSKDFMYFECQECNRLICEQNPSNGYMVQYRSMLPDDEDEQLRICLQCFENLMFSEGLQEYQVKGYHIYGTFFDEDEIKEKGFELHKSYFIKGTHEAKIINKEVKSMLKDYKVLINYDMLSSFGDEGYISTYIKQR